MNPFYNSQHSPVGAFASFTLGFKGASGGLGIGLSGPACRNVYIGAESAERPGQFLALPFYNEARDHHVETEPAAQDIWGDGGIGNPPVKITQFADDEIVRLTTPARDVWRCGDLEFKIYTPFPSVPDMTLEAEFMSIDPTITKDVLIPAVFAELTLDNSAGASPRKVFFGYEGNDPYCAMRRIDTGTNSGVNMGINGCVDSVGAKCVRPPGVDTGKTGGINGMNIGGANIKGIAQGGITGIFTDDADAVCALAFSADELLAADIADRLSFGLGATGLIVMAAEPYEQRTWRFAVCFYRAGVVTTGVEAVYMYTRHFKDIEDVACYALKNYERYIAEAAHFDAMIMERGLGVDRRFLLSQAIKSYYGSTQLLWDKEAAAPLWVVNEGAYRMMNTLDLAVDQLFFEMLKNPWTVRSVLDQYVNRYSYTDEVKNGAGEKFPGGIGFAHDMGVANAFSAPGRSAYELGSRRGCYSYMTQEQLVNWILCAGVYWEGAGDGEWLERRRQVIGQCLTSMLNRDGAGEGGRDGVMDLDSAKTGDGAEITTYDNVDTALGRARRSSYLAVKCWAAYLALSKMLGALKLGGAAKIADGQAERCADTIMKYRRADGTIPALLEEGNTAVTLSVVEGLVYPVVMGLFEDMALAEKYSVFISALKKHFEAALGKGCKFADGSWKMSGTSDNSWLSKTFLCQFIAEKIFKQAPDAGADRVHASWLLDPENAMQAFGDQMRAGKLCGSAYYPRGVTGILWLG
ncbi:MAG: glycoside hydrolase family 52 protein [Chitinispirillales bacterium]|jgi:hypothetical protein|nr:glycoside hydrolase family 52 protein [Chitinispirillales bacterium]